MYDGEVGLLTRLDGVADEAAFVVQRSIPLSHDQVFLFLCGIVLQRIVGEVHTPLLYLAVGGGDEAEVIDLGVDTERGDQTDVWSFWRLDRTETAVVGIVYVTDLEAGTLTRQTARAEGREAALVRDLGQRVRLIHELRQRVRPEEGVHDRGQGLGVDQISGDEDLIVADVHTLTDGAGHTC